MSTLEEMVETLPRCEDGDGQVFVAKSGCTACGGSGYVPGFSWTSDSAYNNDRPSMSNVYVPCRCMTELERMNRRFRGAT